MNKLAYLTNHHVLTENQTERLLDLALESSEDVVRHVRTSADRHALSGQTGLPEDRLLLAGVVSNLLTMEGPGAYIAEGIVEHTTWEQVDLRDESLRDIMETLATADRQGLQTWLGTVGLDFMRAPGKQESERSERRSRWILGLFFLALVASLIGQQWSQLFPPAAESAELLGVQWLQRRLSLTNLAYLGFFLVGGLGLMLMLKLFSSLAGRVSDLISTRLMSKRDWLVVAEAMLRLPQWARVGVSVINRINEVLALAGLLFFIFFLASGNLDRFPCWLGIFNIILVGGGFLFIIWIQALGFKNLKSAWATQVRGHFVAYITTTVLIHSALLIASLLLFGFIFAELALPAVTEWGIAQARHVEAEFHAFIKKVISDWYPRSEWRMWSRAYVENWIQNLSSLTQDAQGYLDLGFKTLSKSYLGILFGVAVAEFVYVNYRKGLGALLTWIMVFLTSEFTLEWVDQAISLAPLVTEVSVTALGTSAILAIVSELVGESAPQRDARECPQCFVLADNDAVYCSQCGTRLSDKFKTQVRMIE